MGDAKALAMDRNDPLELLFLQIEPQTFSCDLVKQGHSSRRVICIKGILTGFPNSDATWTEVAV